MLDTGQACHICLGDEPNLVIWKGLCPCRPSVHRECMAAWLAERPDTCPICLRVTVHINRVYTQREDGCCSSETCCQCCCCMSICCLTVFITPLYYVLWGLGVLGCLRTNRPNRIPMVPLEYLEPQV